jgi:hypothetical protein
MAGADCTHAYSNSRRLPDRHALESTAYVDWCRSRYGKSASMRSSTIIDHRGEIDGKVVLLCRQVDDVAIAYSDPTVVQGLIDSIEKVVDL